MKFFYKKTDSTLRGNIGSEIAALMDACKMERLPFIPAYPKRRQDHEGWESIRR